MTTEPDYSYRETHLEEPASETGACSDSWERVHRYPGRRQELAKAVLTIQTEFTRVEHKGWLESHQFVPLDIHNKGQAQLFTRLLTDSKNLTTDHY